MNVACGGWTQRLISRVGSGVGILRQERGWGTNVEFNQMLGCKRLGDFEVEVLL
jgi:hypothetical protein